MMRTLNKIKDFLMIIFLHIITLLYVLASILFLLVVGIIGSFIRRKETIRETRDLIEWIVKKF